MKSSLNTLLASYEVHYQNLRSLHWNIKGAHFFELHTKYEELYNRTQVIIDDIAERILTLGFEPLSRFSDYLAESLIQENEIIHDGKKGMNYIVDAQDVLLTLEKQVFEEATKIGDEGTSAFMSDLIREKEKTRWMFHAWLS